MPVDVNLPEKKQITDLRFPTPIVAPKSYNKLIYSGKEYGGKKATVG
jgi:hypothetical protein